MIPVVCLRRTRLRGTSLACLLLLATLGLVGCGEGTTAQLSSVTIALSGRVMGGQQPIQSSSIQLYAVGRAGNGSTAATLLNNPAYSAADGSFSLTSSGPCGSSAEQLYLVASGGNPGQASGTNNDALTMMTALGSCGQLDASEVIVVNEVTTVAAVWALAPFMVSATNVGSSATNAQGIANAFLNAHLLADTSTGAAATLPSNLAIESGKLYALADALDPCITSSGGAACDALFAAATIPGGAAPQNTLSAALNIVQHPGEDVNAVFAAIVSSPPFPMTLTRPPSDWTMSLTVSGGGLNEPASLAIDSSGDAWVANYAGVLSAFSAQGTPLSSTGYGVGMLSESYGLAIDPSNNVWVTNEETPDHSPTTGSVTAFTGAGSASVGSLLNATSYFYDASIDFPRAVAADTNGNILIADYGNSSATIYSSTGQLVQGGVGAGNAALPVAITADGSHGLWLANQGDNSVTHISSSGAVLAHIACCDGASAIATDKDGNAWIANYNNSSVTEVSSSGAIVLGTDSDGGIANNNPSGIAIDAGQNVWIANFRGNNIAELTGNAGTTAAGAGISPPSGYGMDANLVLPFGIALDASGNVWVTNFGRNTVVMFFGLATPTATPAIALPKVP